MIKLNLKTDTGIGSIDAKENESIQLPRLELKDKTFLGWHFYPDLSYGFMNIDVDRDTSLYATTTSGPAYVLESYFRGVPGDDKDERCHFRRYVVDVYLENAVAEKGVFKIENCNCILYYLGNVPVDNIKTTIYDTTNRRNGPYDGEGYITTTDIQVEWTSEKPIDAINSRKKIATLMLCFSKWGMRYREIEKRTSDEIIIPARGFSAAVGDNYASVSANFYKGYVLEEPITQANSVIHSVKSESELPNINFGNLLSRFAVLSDSHIGVGYKWENYDWIYCVFENLKKIHEKTPLDFVLQLGDNIDNGYEASYEKDYEIYKEVVKKLAICDPNNPIEGRLSGTIAHYEMQGNHDPATKTRFLNKKLWYAENCNGEKVAFISFCTKYGGYPAVNFSVSKSGISYKSYGILTDEMVEFVEKSILTAKKEGAKHIVLCNHFGIAQDLGAPILPESGLGKIEALCSKYDIRLYLSGHEHNSAYSVRKYNNLYDFDAAMTKDKYAVFELFEQHVKLTVYRTRDNEIDRIDVIEL